jgi:threonine dehydrogenase-like Zn-dependent dehydrogenase
VSGIVRAVGANVKHFKVGDRVPALSNATYAELVAVDDSDVTHLPDGVRAYLPLEIGRRECHLEKAQPIDANRWPSVRCT